jgi:hypothetical protein
MSQYVLLDFQLDSKAANSVLYFGNLSAFGVRVAENGVYLYERGWNARPQWWLPETIVLPADQLFRYHNSTLSTQNTSQYGPSLYHSPVVVKGLSIFSTREIVGLLPGDYNATFWWEVMAKKPGTQVNVSIVENPVLFNITPIFSTSTQVHYAITQAMGSSSALVPSYLQPPSTGPETLGNLTVPFQLVTPGEVSMVVYEQSARMSLVLFAIVLTQTSPA